MWRCLALERCYWSQTLPEHQIADQAAGEEGEGAGDDEADIEANGHALVGGDVAAARLGDRQRDDDNGERRQDVDRADMAGDAAHPETVDGGDEHQAHPDAARHFMRGRAIAARQHPCAERQRGDDGAEVDPQRPGRGLIAAGGLMRAHEGAQVNHAAYRDQHDGEAADQREAAFGGAGCGCGVGGVVGAAVGHGGRLSFVVGGAAALRRLLSAVG